MLNAGSGSGNVCSAGPCPAADLPVGGVGLRPRLARRLPAALGPDLAATALARRPYDLRHAALSLWLNASGTPAEVAARAGNSARVLHEVYLHCTDGQEDAVSQRIEDALNAGTGITHPSPRAKASGYTHRRHRPRSAASDGAAASATASRRELASLPPACGNTSAAAATTTTTTTGGVPVTWDLARAAVSSGLLP